MTTVHSGAVVLPLPDQSPPLRLNTDAITSIDEIKTVLKALDIWFRKDHAESLGILHLMHRE